MIELPLRVNMTVDTSQTSYRVGVNSNLHSISMKSALTFAPLYQGVYEMYPSLEEQTLHTQEYLLTRDIVVKPVPSNYGRITYNGSYLLVE